MKPAGKILGLTSCGSLRVAWRADFNKEEPLFVMLDGLMVPLFIEDMPRRGQVVFADVDTPQRAEMLVGCELFTRGGEDEEEDFEGWEAVLGEFRGRIIETPHVDDVNPLFVVEVDGREVLVPAALAASVDGHTINFDVPEGLMGLNYNSQ